MLCKRIIPCLDILNGRVVKGVNFEGMQDAGDPVEAAARYDAMGADELVFLDITASGEGRGTMVEVVKKVAAGIFIPLTVGGGISSLEDVSRLLMAGADKVSLNTAAVRQPTLITQVALRYGSQCAVAAVDAKKRADGAGWEVYIQGGRIPTGIDALDWCGRVAELGAGEILLTSIDADGMGSGYDLELLSQAAARVNVPVIASGGAGSPEHFYRAVSEGGADGLLAASVFHFEQIGIKELKDYLNERGVPVRRLCDEI